MPFVKCAFISDPSARLEVRGVSVFESNTELVVYGVRLSRTPEVSAVEPIEEPVVELEVGGSIYSFSSWSEILWIHRVNNRRVRRTGLALLCGKIFDFSLSVALWVSWVLLSLGKLIKHIC